MLQFATLHAHGLRRSCRSLRQAEPPSKNQGTETKESECWWSGHRGDQLIKACNRCTRPIIEEGHPLNIAPSFTDEVEMKRRSRRRRYNRDCSLRRFCCEGVQNA